MKLSNVNNLTTYLRSRHPEDQQDAERMLRECSWRKPATTTHGKRRQELEFSKACRKLALPIKSTNRLAHEVAERIATDNPDEKYFISSAALWFPHEENLRFIKFKQGLEEKFGMRFDDTAGGLMFRQATDRKDDAKFIAAIKAMLDFGIDKSNICSGLPDAYR